MTLTEIIAEMRRKKLEVHEIICADYPESAQRIADEYNALLLAILDALEMAMKEIYSGEYIAAYDITARLAAILSRPSRPNK